MGMDEGVEQLDEYVVLHEFRALTTHENEVEHVIKDSDLKILPHRTNRFLKLRQL